MKGMIGKALLCFSLVIPSGVVSQVYAAPRLDSEQPVMAIVIDDIGDNRAKGLAAINLPGAMTYAFLPHTPHSFELAKTAHHLGKEVILHAPMENKAGLRLGPGAMKDRHNADELNAILKGSLDSIPYVVGMNNHMGSLLTEKRQSMDVVMSVVNKRKMFFIDSVTTSNTVAWKAAHEHGVPYLVRDVFLDNKQQRSYIHKQFKEALTIAVTQGHAVVIGHPYPETISYLEEVLPILKQLNIRLVTASELLQMRSQTRLMLAEPKLEQSCDREEGHCASLTVTVKQ